MRPVAHAIAIAAAGGCGAVLRYLLTINIAYDVVITLCINIAGCLCIGLLRTMPSARVHISPALEDILCVGLLGGLTTFSAFAWHILSLPPTMAVLYLAASVLLGLAACALGMYWGRCWSR